MESPASPVEKMLNKIYFFNRIFFILRNFQAIDIFRFKPGRKSNCKIYSNNDNIIVNLLFNQIVACIMSNSGGTIFSIGIPFRS